MLFLKRRPYENINNRSQGVRRKEPGGKSKEHPTRQEPNKRSSD